MAAAGGTAIRADNNAGGQCEGWSGKTDSELNCLAAPIARAGTDGTSRTRREDRTGSSNSYKILLPANILSQSPLSILSLESATQFLMVIDSKPVGLTIGYQNVCFVFSPQLLVSQYLSCFMPIGLDH